MTDPERAEPAGEAEHAARPAGGEDDTNVRTEEPEAGSPTAEGADALNEDAADEELDPGPELISELEELLGGERAIVYHASSGEMGPWDLRPFYEMLKVLGRQERLAVVIQSRGGSADAAHVLLNLLREYTAHLDVYVPTHASSAATLFTLGADVLWMGPSSELSPIDPQVPVDPRLLIPMDDPEGAQYDLGAEPIHIPAHVIKDFLELAGVIESPHPRPKVNIARLQTLLKHAPLNPWVLGWYERADKVSRLYAKMALVDHLLAAHEPDPESRDALADAIVEALVDGYASHEAGILRGEARKIGIPVTDCPDDVWDKLEEISDYYQHVVRTQNVARVIETTDGFHVTAAKQTRRCEECAERNELVEGLRYCTKCGKPLYRECRACEQRLREGWRHCPRCGASTSDTST